MSRVSVDSSLNAPASFIVFNGQEPVGPVRFPRSLRRRSWGSTGAALALVLAACGGGSGGAGDEAEPPVQPPTTEVPAGPTVNRTLLIDLDAATYDAVQRGIAQGQLPNLARLHLQMAYSGGVAGSPSQQPTLDAPGWATLLTGQWAHRHRVLSAAPQQVISGQTVFARIDDRIGSTGAVVASTGLAKMLSPLHETGALDTLYDCGSSATATACVTGQAEQMIGAGTYASVLAQYHAASDAALNHGIASPEYAATLVSLDRAVGQLLEAAARRDSDRWLVVVTGNHGLSDNSQDDGLPLIPESTTFVALNEAPNTGTLGVGAERPDELATLYTHTGIADIAPTLLAHLNSLPPAENHALDGAALIGAPAVTQLTASVADNQSSEARVELSWAAPQGASVSILRDGTPIASDLPAESTAYTDESVAATLPGKGTYAFNYTITAKTAAGAASRSTLSPPLTYLPPVPLAPTLANGLVTYYPFGASLPPVDAKGNSEMAPFSAQLPAQAGLVVPGPFTGTHGLLIDTDYVTPEGLEAYKLTPKTGFDISKGNTPQFTIGFWFKAPTCVSKSNVTILANKNYVSGGNAGVAIGMFSSSGNQCGIAFNIGSGGGVRADGPTGPYTQITVDRWVYLAFSVDGVGRTMNAYVHDPVTRTSSKVVSNKSTGSVDLSKLSAFPQWGIGDDGSGAYLMNKCNGAVTPPYFAGKCATAPTYQQIFGDLAMWNRVLTDDELQSIFLSNKPLSTLPLQ